MADGRTVVEAKYDNGNTGHQYCTPAGSPKRFLNLKPTVQEAFRLRIHSFNPRIKFTCAVPSYTAVRIPLIGVKKVGTNIEKGLPKKCAVET